MRKSLKNRGAGLTSIGRMAVATWIMAVVAACGGGQSCSCLKPLPNGFPAEKRNPNSIQARVSPEGIQFLQTNIGTLIGSLIPGGLSFAIPPTCSGSTQICCPGGVSPPNPDPMCHATAAVTNAVLSPQEGMNALDFTIRATLATSSASGNTMPVHATFIGITVDCDVSINTMASGVQDLALQGRLSMAIDPRTQTTRMSVTNVTVADLDNGDITLSGGALCTIADLIKPLFIGTLTSQFTGTIGGTINDQLCAKCTGMAPLAQECGTFATACTMGVCMQPAASGMGDECVQKLGAEGQVDLGTLLASFAPGLQAGMDIYAVAGGYAESNAMGLNLGLLGGAEPNPAAGSSCVPQTAAPALAPAPRSATFGGMAMAPVSHHVGIGIHKSYLERALFAIWKGGALCLNVGGATVAQLNSETFNLLVPSLPDVLGDWPVPLSLKLLPQKPPEVTLGKNEIRRDMSGNRTLGDPLLKLKLPGLILEFYGLVQDRYVRLFKVTTDLTLPIGLDVDAAGKLIPVLGDARMAFQNIVVSDLDLLTDDPMQVADTLPALLGVALPLLTQGLSGFALPNLMGLKLDIPAGGITSTDMNTFMGIFTNLAAATPIVRPVQTEAQVIALALPAKADWAASIRDAKKAPAVTLRVRASDAEGALTAGTYEWQYRFDGGPWSVFQDAEQLTLRDPSLYWQARHLVEVRTRRVGETTSLGEIVTLPVLVDVLPPRVRAQADGTLEALDGVTAVADLRWAFRMPDGTTTAWSREARIPEGALAAYVTDEAGNVSSLWIRAAAPGEEPAIESGDEAPAARGTGCSSGGSGPSSGGLAVLGLCLLAVLHRRRGALVKVAAVAMLPFAACSNDAISGVTFDGGAGRGGAGGAGGAPVADGPVGPMPDAPPMFNTPGAQGRYSDLAAGGGKVLVSGYEAKFGDLLVGEPGTDGKVAWRFVDGVPAEAPVFAASGYRGGIRGEGDDVGEYTSIALGSDGKAMIAYLDVTHGALKIAHAMDAGNTMWATHTVDAPPMGAMLPSGSDVKFGTTVMMTSLALDAQGVPSVAYLMSGLKGMGGKVTAELRYARASSASPAAQGDWTVTKIETVNVPCAGLCASTEACIGDVDMMNMPTGGSTCKAKATGCMPACTTDQECVMNGMAKACVAKIAPPGSLDLPHGVGLWPALVFGMDGKPVVVYYARDNDGKAVGQLKMATQNGAMWATSVLDMGGDVGGFASVAVGADGALHIAYQDMARGQLLYKKVMGAMAGMREVVDDGMRMDGVHMVGADATIALSGDDVRIVYQDQRSVDLLMSKRMGTMWMRSELKTGRIGNGFFARVVTDGGMFWVSDFYYDRMENPFGGVEVFRAP